MGRFQEEFFRLAVRLLRHLILAAATRQDAADVKKSSVDALSDVLLDALGALSKELNGK